jgi:hypothetical protein
MSLGDYQQLLEVTRPAGRRSWRVEDEPASTEWPTAYEQALVDPDPTDALRTAVVQAREAGTDRDTIQRHLTALRVHLQQADRDADEDVVLEVMDFLTGWSSPHMRID